MEPRSFQLFGISSDKENEKEIEKEQAALLKKKKKKKNRFEVGPNYKGNCVFSFFDFSLISDLTSLIRIRKEQNQQ